MLPLFSFFLVLGVQLVWANLDFSVSLDLSTCNIIFNPPIGTHELFLALEARYPLILDHDQRVSAAITDHCVNFEAQNSASPQLSWWQPQPPATTCYDTSTANDSLQEVRHLDIGTFKPKLQNKKLLGQKFSDCASGLKDALLINFDSGLSEFGKHRKPRERLDGQRAVEHRTVRHIGACEKHRRAKTKCNPACAFGSKNAIAKIAEVPEASSTTKNEAFTNSRMDSDWHTLPDAGPVQREKQVVFQARLEEDFVRRLRAAARERTGLLGFQDRKAYVGKDHSWFTEFINEDMLEPSDFMDTSSSSLSIHPTRSTTASLPTRTLLRSVWASYPSPRAQEQVQYLYPPSSSSTAVTTWRARAIATPAGQFWSSMYYPRDLFAQDTIVKVSSESPLMLHLGSSDFENTWIECLRDLGRYRMSIEDENTAMRDHWVRTLPSVRPLASPKYSASHLSWNELNAAIAAIPTSLLRRILQKHLPSDDHYRMLVMSLRLYSPLLNRSMRQYLQRSTEDYDNDEELAIERASTIRYRAERVLSLARILLSSAGH